MNLDELTIVYEKAGKVFDGMDNDTIKNLLHEYYTKKSATKIIEEYKLDVRPGLFYKDFPPVESGENCPYDNSTMIIDLPSKTSSNYSYAKDVAYCPKCNHKDSDSCNCQECLKKIGEEKDKKLRLIQKTYEFDDGILVSEDTLSLEDKLYLAALVRGFIDENLSYIHSLKSNKDKLSPTLEMDIKIMRHLISRNIIRPHPNSEIAAFEEGENFPYSYYTEYVNYQIALEPFDNSYPKMIERITYPETHPFFENRPASLDLWKNVALEESKEYLLYRMKAVGFDFSPGDKTNNILAHILERYSVSQSCSFIFSAVAYANQWHVEKRVPKFRAANSVITNIERNSEKAFSEGWKVKSYGRNWDLPQSQVSKVLYNSILKISDLGFSEVPDKNF
ncbi:hypothetical protein HCA64_08880 [Listeria booriae]|uniref:hypothetical protein n=1 Tax=Listeria booriae TaxID=1552123 RepID=UPI001623B22F|nr:hypothetical protein [Listeria booriae]MBC1906592.1 hypothetical protein [Listeria booriae]